MVSKTFVLGAGFSKHAWLGSGSLARPCLFDSCRHHSRAVYWGAHPLAAKIWRRDGRVGSPNPM